MTTPVQPISAMLLNVASSNPFGFSLSRILRNALIGAFDFTQPRALSRSITCSSVNNAMVLSRNASYW